MQGEDFPEKAPYANPSLSALQFSFKQSGGNRMMAHDPNRTGENAHKPVGFIEWDKKTGEISGVGTHPSYARRGLATTLMTMARQHAADSQPPVQQVKGQRKLFQMPVENPQKAIVAPRHSSTRTEAGEGWARSVGGFLPTRRMPSRAEQRRRALG